jgi:hypothetical protein
MSEDEEEVPTEQQKIIIDNWKQLQKIPVLEYFDKGWKPRVKTKLNGTRYITIRNRIKKEGKWVDSEKSLGRYDPERWELLLEMYPRDDIVFPKKRSHKGRSKRTSVLSTKVAKPKPLSSTVHLDIGTLHWYQWLQDQGYGGSLDEFINDSINGYFREHHKLELAVVIEKG